MKPNCFSTCDLWVVLPVQSTWFLSRVTWSHQGWEVSFRCADTDSDGESLREPRKVKTALGYSLTFLFTCYPSEGLEKTYLARVGKGPHFSICSTLGLKLLLSHSLREICSKCESKINTPNFTSHSLSTFGLIEMLRRSKFAFNLALKYVLLRSNYF